MILMMMIIMMIIIVRAAERGRQECREVVVVELREGLGMAADVVYVYGRAGARTTTYITRCAARETFGNQAGHNAQPLDSGLGMAADVGQDADANLHTYIYIYIYMYLFTHSQVPNSPEWAA